MAQEKILLATLTTDANGECTYTYTGSGAGKVDLIGEYRGFSSESYEIIDATFYDKGLSGSGNHNDNWSTSAYLDVNRGDTYTTLSRNATTGTAAHRANNDNEFVGDFVIEWDNHLELNGSNYILVTGTSDTAFNLSWLGNIINAHIRIEVVGLSIKSYVNGVQVDQVRTVANRSANDGLKVRFQINASGNDIGYSNFMIYSI